MATSFDSVRRRIAIGAVVLGATGIGFAPILVRWSEVGPCATAGYRVLLSLPLLLAMVWHERSQQAAATPRGRAGEFPWVLAAGVLFAADLGLWHWSLQFTSVANSTLLVNLTPVLVTLGAWFWFRERITRFFLFGLAAALGGATLLVAGSTRLGPANLDGDILALLATAFYAGYLLTVKRLRRVLSTAAVMAWSGVAMCPAAFGLGLLGGEKLWPDSWRGWEVLLAMALVSHVGGQVLIAYGLGHLPASYSSVGLLWQPVVAALAAWIWLGEPLTALQVGGGSGVLLGIALATRTIGEGQAGKFDRNHASRDR